MKFWLRYVRYCTIGFFIALLSVIPVRLLVAHNQAPLPQAIFVLGGDPHREKAAAQLAKHYPKLEVWISTGEMPAVSRRIFDAIGIPDQRVHRDYQATDTLTNFTTHTSLLPQHRIQHVYLITSDFHMRRARAIATIVFGSRGIAVTPIAVSSTKSQEPDLQILRDVARSGLWLITGKTGSSLSKHFERL